MLVPKVERALGRAPRQYFSEFRAVNGVSFEVGRGETVGIVGRNGSGKSTLLQMICGTLNPTSGSVEVRGRIAALLELGSGFNPEFTGRENVFLNAAILGLSHEETVSRFDQIAKFADIGDFIDQPVKTYSSGMYVRLAFAVAINVDPDILVVDEALAVGDEAFQRKCFARIENIRDNGASILFVSHGSQTILQLCDRAILMDRGEKILEGRPKTVINQYQRFLSLSGAEADVAREAIKLMDGWAEQTATASPTQIVSAPIVNDTKSDGWYDESIKSLNPVELPSRGARISNVRFTTTSGTTVNCLAMGGTYSLRYDVHFERPIDRVGFGMLIKTANGIDLGGVGSSIRDELVDIPFDQSFVEVEMKFQCRLHPGMYFINVGTGCIQDGEEIILHKILDAECFNVVAEDKLPFSGRVDFGIAYSIRIRDADSTTAPLAIKE